MWVERSLSCKELFAAYKRENEQWTEGEQVVNRQWLNIGLTLGGITQDSGTVFSKASAFSLYLIPSFCMGTLVKTKDWQG